MAKYTYTAAGQLASIDDRRTGEITWYLYDVNGNLIQSYVETRSSNAIETETKYVYDANDRLLGSAQQLNLATSSGVVSSTFERSYGYDLYGRLSGVEDFTQYSWATTTPTYNALGQLTQKNITFNSYSWVCSSTTSYSYVMNGNTTSSRVASITVGMDFSIAGESEISSSHSTTYRYTYDANGNITQITDANGYIFSSKHKNITKSRSKHLKGACSCFFGVPK